MLSILFVTRLIRAQAFILILHTVCTYLYVLDLSACLIPLITIFSFKGFTIKLDYWILLSSDSSLIFYNSNLSTVVMFIINLLLFVMAFFIVHYSNHLTPTFIFYLLGFFFDNLVSLFTFV